VIPTQYFTLPSVPQFASIFDPARGTVAATLMLRRARTLFAEADLLGPVEAAVLRAVGDGRARPHRIAERLNPATRAMVDTGLLYDVIDQCRREGPLRAERDRRGRSWVVTPAGRHRLRERGAFAVRLGQLIARGT
jgi:hypothetical protein